MTEGLEERRRNAGCGDLVLLSFVNFTVIVKIPDSCLIGPCFGYDAVSLCFYLTLCGSYHFSSSYISSCEKMADVEKFYRFVEDF